MSVLIVLVVTDGLCVREWDILSQDTREPLGRSIQHTTPSCHSQALPSKVCLCLSLFVSIRKTWNILSKVEPANQTTAKFGAPKPRSLLDTLFYGILQDCSPTQTALYSAGYKISLFHQLITVLLSPWHLPPSSPLAPSFLHRCQLLLSSEIF